MFFFRGFLYSYFCLVGRAAARCSSPLCQRAVGASSALPWLPLLGGARRHLLASRGLGPAARCAVAGRGAAGAGPCAPPRRQGCGRLGAAGGGFRPARVAVVVKTTRYEFEQQRYRYAGLSEEDLKELIRFSYLLSRVDGGTFPVTSYLIGLSRP
ncbi:NAD kinase 2, mitochondrial-like isoform 2-T2 [Ciconia maguari]